MKRLLVSFFLLFATSAFAADVRLTWDARDTSDPVPWQVVRVYERTGTAPYSYQLLTEVPGTVTEAVVRGVTPGVHTFIVRSVSPTPIESADSNSVAGQVPNAPTGVKAEAVITIMVPIGAAVKQ